MIYNDAWFHDDSHEPYNAEPDRGYISGEDPLESRNVYSHLFYVLISISACILLLVGSADPEIVETEAKIYWDKQARDYVNQVLQEKNRVLNELRAREKELQAKCLN